MAVFIVDAETLVHARFSRSPLVECVAGLNILLRRNCLPWHRRWRDRHLIGFREYTRENPVAAAVATHAFATTWAADFLLTPPAPLGDIEHELSHFETFDDDRIRRDLAEVRSPLPPVLGVTGLAGHVIELIRWVWQHTIAEEWHRRKHTLHADVLARTSRLGESGWRAVFDGLRPGMRWLGDNRLQYDPRPYPDTDIRGKSLSLFAAHCRSGWVAWQPHDPMQYSIVYPVTGIHCDEQSAPGSLARLLGPARATILVNTAQPATTTTLSATTGLSIGAVGNHLRVLLDAGLLQRRRSGREVLYWWTESARHLHSGAT